MRRTYQLSSGKVIDCLYNQYGGITVMNSNGKERISFDRNTDDPTFEFNGETIHVNDFKYTPLEQLITKVDKAVQAGERWGSTESEVLATIMKEKDNVAFEMQIDCFDTLVPIMGIGIKSSNGPSVLDIMVPVEDRWSTENWGYKIELQAEDPRIRAISGKTTLYFSDFWSMCMNGSIKIVNKNKYREEHPIARVIVDKVISVI
jgi:hypothetical protein